MPSNFEHRVHTGFDKREGKYVGLPLQWASIVGNNQILKSSNRPLPLVDPSEITPTEILDLKTIVRPHANDLVAKLGNGGPGAGLASSLPKTSHVARSNSLRSSSPPRVRRDLRGNANVPPSVPEEPVGYTSMRRDGTLPPPKLQPPHIPPHSTRPHQLPPPPHLNNEQLNNGSAMYPMNGNPMQPLNIHTDIPAPYFNNTNNNHR